MEPKDINHNPKNEDNNKKVSQSEESHKNEHTATKRLMENDEFQYKSELEKKTAANEGKRENYTKKKTKAKGFITALSAGVIGSLLTLSIIPFTDYPALLLSENKAVNTADSSAESKGPVEVKQTSVTQSDIADMVEQTSPAIVGVVNIQKQTSSLDPFRQQQPGEAVESGSGSGVIFKKEGNNAFIVTNNHVIENAEQIEISLESGEKTTAELIGADALSDLAVLRIDAKYAKAVLDFGDSSKLRPGEEVLAIGNPLGLDFSRSVTQGIVSAVNRSVSVTTSAGEWELNVIQTDAAINPGNSGGALMNTQGQVIGINSLKISEDGVEGLGFAIPSNEVVPIINQIIETGKVQRVYLGVSLASLEEVPSYFLESLPSSIEGGVMVTSVEPNSTASKAGIQVQDIIVSIDDTKITNATELRKYLYNELEPGDKAKIKYYRQGKLKTVTVTLNSTQANMN